MEVEDVIRGKRVKVIADSYGVIPIGATGTLLETHYSAPYVHFDEHYEGCYTEDGFPNVKTIDHYKLDEI